MTDDIPDELKDLPDGSITDAETDTDTEKQWFAYDGKRYWVEVKKDLPGQKVMDIRGDNTSIQRGQEQLDIGGLMSDMMCALIVDTSLDEPVEATIKTCSSGFYDKLNEAVEEVSGGLEGLDVDEGK